MSKFFAVFFCFALLQSVANAQVSGITYGAPSQIVNGFAGTEYLGSGDTLYSGMSWTVTTESNSAVVTIISVWSPGGTSTTTTFTVPANSVDYDLSSNSSFTTPSPAGDSYTCTFTLQSGGVGNNTPAVFNKAATPDPGEEGPG